MWMQEPDLLKQIFATMNMPESLAELEIKSAIRMERGIALPDAATSSPTRPPGARRAGADTGSLQALQCLSRASDLFGQVPPSCLMQHCLSGSLQAFQCLSRGL